MTANLSGCALPREATRLDEDREAPVGKKDAVDTAAPVDRQAAGPDESVNFATFKGRMVDLTRRVEIDGVTREVTEQGRVIDGNALGLIFKRRSQRTQDLVEAGEVLAIVPIQTARLQAIGKKHLKEVTSATVRRHLVDFHAIKLSEVESLSPEAAMLMHDDIDHADLGHDHDADARPVAPVIVDAEKDEILSRISSLRRSA